MKNKWIQSVLKNHKKGSLSRQLGVPQEKNIPITLLNKVINADNGQTITNPTSIGRRKIKVTKLLTQRSILARNLKNISKNTNI
jgi:hypothetical protein